MEAAKEIFEEHGFLNARISDIAERAGQSHGSFYYYFDSKNEVFLEVAEVVTERTYAAPLDDVILANNRLEVPQRIQESMRRTMDNYRKEARILGLIEHVARCDDEVNAMRLARHRRFTERVAKTVAQLQARGMADPTLDPLVTATALGGLTQRFAELWLTDGAIDSTQDHVVDQLSRLFVNALRLTKRPPKP